MKRVVPGLLIAGFWLLLLLKGSILLFCLVMAIVVLLAADEYIKMVVDSGIPAWERLLLGFFLSIPLFFVCFSPKLQSIAPGMILVLAVLTSYLLYRYKDLKDAFGLYAKLIFGALYIGFLGAHLVLLRTLPDGPMWLIIASAITACSDTGAYFVGRAIGKRKLCPSISPNKTIEGAVGGVVAGSIAAIGFSMLLLPTVNLLFILLSAIFLSIVGILGDLTESIIKRGTGNKDSGKWLAGHGGILDRVDSLLFVGPVFYYLLVFWIYS